MPGKGESEVMFTSTRLDLRKIKAIGDKCRRLPLKEIIKRKVNGNKKTDVISNASHQMSKNERFL